jgi:hypothetical protein
MKILTITAKGIDNELQPFYILNPVNVVVHEGEVEKPGNIKDGKGNPLPIKVKKTFVRVAGQPIFAEESPIELLKQLQETE